MHYVIGETWFTHWLMFFTACGLVGFLAALMNFIDLVFDLAMIRNDEKWLEMARGIFKDDEEDALYLLERSRQLTQRLEVCLNLRKYL